MWGPFILLVTLGVLQSCLALEDICQVDTGGTCRLLGCRSDRGPTTCVGGECLCQAGACAFDGWCTSTCPKDTGGTCAIFGCKSNRGPTDCVKGHCLCKRGYCLSKQGVCTSTCEKDTGGTCGLLGCKKWRGADCLHGRCVCGADACSFKGKCVRGGALPTDLALAAASNNTEVLSLEDADFTLGVMLSELPDLDAQALLMLVGLVSVPTLLVSIAVRRFPRRAGAMAEPLLASDGAEAASTAGGALPAEPKGSASGGLTLA